MAKTCQLLTLNRIYKPINHEKFTTSTNLKIMMTAENIYSELIKTDYGQW